MSRFLFSATNAMPPFHAFDSLSVSFTCPYGTQNTDASLRRRKKVLGNGTELDSRTKPSSAMYDVALCYYGMVETVRETKK